MQLTIRARGFTVSAPMRDYCERALRFALGRFVDRLGPIVARFSDVNGPKGGDDKRCHLLVPVAGGQTVSVERVHGDLYAAMDLAAARAAHAVRRELGKKRSFPREAA